MLPSTRRFFFFTANKNLPRVFAPDHPLGTNKRFLLSILRLLWYFIGEAGIRLSLAGLIPRSRGGVGSTVLLLLRSANFIVDHNPPATSLSIINFPNDANPPTLEEYRRRSTVYRARFVRNSSKACVIAAEWLVPVS